MTSGGEASAWPAVDMVTLRVDRWERVRAMMLELGLDHLVLTSADAIRYVTDFRSQLTPESNQWFAVVVDVDGSSDVFVPYVDQRIDEPLADLPAVRSMQPLPAWAPSTMHPLAWSRQVAAALSTGSSSTIGFEGLDPTVLLALKTHMPDARWRPISQDLDEVRRAKLPSEVELLAAAARVNSRACEAAIAAGVVGARDYDFIAAAASYQLRAGVEFVTHSVCNVRSPSGDWFAYGGELREGDTFMFDVGVYGRGGYCSDLARTGFVGEPPREVAKAYAVLLDALRAGEEAVRPGVLASEVDDVVNRYIERQGLPSTPYAMGHGIGLRMCEAPTIFRPHLMDTDARFRVGDVIALEPETHVDVDGVPVVLKLEDNYFLGEDGLVALSDAAY